ncbi:hypothetical protein MLD38_010777 [Melastoma candidum]|uniref:Uncharacterized protein n=1 Tax=Melastoma candidum TaxID=119954 RepID=A0ACB9R215_9MYRT|nr:hypothetical protein MLD38_010777 [Melastoma candidum]
MEVEMGCLRVETNGEKKSVSILMVNGCVKGVLDRMVEVRRDVLRNGVMWPQRKGMIKFRVMPRFCEGTEMGHTKVKVFRWRVPRGAMESARGVTAAAPAPKERGSAWIKSSLEIFGRRIVDCNAAPLERISPGVRYLLGGFRMVVRCMGSRGSDRCTLRMSGLPCPLHGVLSSHSCRKGSWECAFANSVKGFNGKRLHMVQYQDGWMSETQIIDAMKIIYVLTNPAKVSMASKLSVQLIQAGSVKSEGDRHLSKACIRQHDEQTWRKQRKPVSGKLDVNVFKWLQQQKHANEKISIRRAVGDGSNRGREQWLG